MTTTKSPQGKVRPDPGLLGIYLNDHLTGATAGMELARRMAGSQHMPDARDELRRLADEIAEDRAALTQIMETLGVPLRHYKVYLGWVAEKVGRIKPNGRLVGRSPLSDLLELESLMLGVEGKAALWRVLRNIAGAERRLETRRLDKLIERAQSQSRTLGELHLKVASRTFHKT
ncbi:hypothetical protein ACRYCC_40015 [Actinomadura scrupuli]|uniref:hypothetical protein n=1 Tax=Actinomadura scrupuli TaxID=559629 RepID=UPI003D97E8F1